MTMLLIQVWAGHLMLLSVTLPVTDCESAKEMVSLVTHREIPVSVPVRHEATCYEHESARVDAGAATTGG